MTVEQEPQDQAAATPGGGADGPSPEPAGPAEQAGAGEGDATAGAEGGSSNGEAFDGKAEGEIPAEAADRRVEDLQAACDRLESALAEAAEERRRLLEQLQRTRSEFDNFRRRTARESEALKKRASEDLVVRLLPVLDNLERAVGATAEGEAGLALAQGVSLVLKQFQAVLTEEGLEAVPAVGQPFDPELHEAVERLPAPRGIPPGHVVEELQKGYRMGGRLLRPAMVKVASEASPEAPPPADPAAQA